MSLDLQNKKPNSLHSSSESLQLYARMPQTRMLFFGGAHDNGYVPTLRSLHTERHLQKLTILKGSVDVAYEIGLFIDETGTPLVSFDGLFLQTTLENGPGLRRARLASTSSSTGNRLPFVGSRLAQGEASSRPASRFAMIKDSPSRVTDSIPNTPPLPDSSSELGPSADDVVTIEEEGAPYEHEPSTTSRQRDPDKVRDSQIIHA